MTFLLRLMSDTTEPRNDSREQATAKSLCADASTSPGSAALLPALVDVHQRLPPVTAARAWPGRRQARAPPEQQADAQGDQDDGDERSSPLDLLDALDEDRDERA